MNYYDGTKLLSLKDLNGGTPELYFVVGNRTGGKTTWFNRYLINRFKKNGYKFMLLYRWGYELTDVANKFFKDIGELFFPNDTMTEIVRAKGKYIELFLNEQSCGYAVCLNSANSVKKLSHYFNDVERIVFDEFMPEDGVYCPNEIEKFQSIHMSVSRGHGKAVRYVPVFLISNAVTLLNPYFEALGIGVRLQSETKYLKGDGFVVESYFNEEVHKAQEQSAFNRAFNASKYQVYAGQNIYLNDNLTFVEKLSGLNDYVVTIKYKGVDYAVRRYPELGLLYCDKRVDGSFPLKISATKDDHTLNYVMLENYRLLILQFRQFFNRGCFRFKDLSCKDCIMSIIGIY